MTRLIAAAILAYLAVLVYVMAAEWAGRITGHPEPDALAEPWFA